MKRILVMLLIGCVAMSGCSRMTKTGAPGDSIDVIAHRGASAYAPENTMASFMKAKELGADWFELDCTLSRDGEVVVMHDNTVDRTTNGVGAVGDMSLFELKQLDAGSWFEPQFAGERIPTLGQALDEARLRFGVYVEVKGRDNDAELIRAILAEAGDLRVRDEAFSLRMIELIEASGSKNLELARAVIQEIAAKKRERYVVVQSFSPIICAVVAIEAPKIRVELLGTDDEDDPKTWDKLLRIGYLIDVAGFNVNLESLSPDRVLDFHAADKTVSVWTINDLASMKMVANWGVDGIITNKPQIARKVSKAQGGATNDVPH